MLTSKTVNMNATITIEGNSKDIVTLSGNLNADGSYSINRYIHEREIYAANRETMNADEASFEALLLGVTE